MKTNPQYDDFAIVRRLSGDMTASESRDFDNRLSTDDRLRRDYDAMATLWHDTAALQRAASIVSRKDDVWQSIANQTTRRIGRRTNVRHTLLRIAAVAIVLIAIGLALVTRDYNAQLDGSLTARRDTVDLPDGSRAILNVGSRVDYAYDGRTRRARMQGMVHFSVAADKQHPFVVEADETTVTVVGTEFTVEDVAGRNRICVDVAEGRVEFRAGGETRLLGAGDNAQYSAGLMTVNHREAQPTGWLSGRLEFRGATLTEVTEQLLDYYPEIRGIRGRTDDEETLVTTTFEDTPLDEVIEELNIHFRKKIVSDNGYVVISD